MRQSEYLDYPDLFKSDPDRYQRTAANLAKAESDYITSEERWLELEVLREGLEVNGK